MTTAVTPSSSGSVLARSPAAHPGEPGGQPVHDRPQGQQLGVGVAKEQDHRASGVPRCRRSGASSRSTAPRRTWSSSTTGSRSAGGRPRWAWAPTRPGHRGRGAPPPGTPSVRRASGPRPPPAPRPPRRHRPQRRFPTQARTPAAGPQRRGHRVQMAGEQPVAQLAGVGRGLGPSRTRPTRAAPARCPRPCARPARRAPPRQQPARQRRPADAVGVPLPPQRGQHHRVVGPSHIGAGRHRVGHRPPATPPGSRTPARPPRASAHPPAQPVGHRRSAARGRPRRRSRGALCDDGHEPVQVEVGLQGIGDAVEPVHPGRSEVHARGRPPLAGSLRRPATIPARNPSDSNSPCSVVPAHRPSCQPRISPSAATSHGAQRPSGRTRPWWMR